MNTEQKAIELVTAALNAHAEGREISCVKLDTWNTREKRLNASEYREKDQIYFLIPGKRPNMLLDTSGKTKYAYSGKRPNMLLDTRNNTTGCIYTFSLGLEKMQLPIFTLCNQENVT